MGALLRWIDVRAGEARAALSVFAILLLIVASHTMLETVRDAMFLAHLGSRSLGMMYIAAAALTLVVGAVSSRLGSRLGARRALTVSLVVAAVGVIVFSLLPPSRPMLMSLYAFSAVTGALLIPQFWASIGSLFDAAQSRRLFGTIALAGILGAVAGSGAASAALLVVRVRALLPVVALGFAVAAGVVGSLPRGRDEPLAARQREADGPLAATFRAEPILKNLAAVVALGSITTLLVDYVFKTTAAANVPPHELGAYFARWSALMNILALLVQLAIARRILDKAGVIGTASFTPSLLGLGSIVSLVTGAPAAILATKIADASLRHSVQRTGIELVYMAVPSAARDRAKPFIDGAIARVSQAMAAAIAIAMTSLVGSSTRPLILVAMLFAMAWGAATASLRRPYLSLFRRALLGPDGETARTPQELDMASLELLVEALGSARPIEVVAAINALERRGRSGIVPSLILLHESAEVIERALEIFGGAARRDWVRLAERLVNDRREIVRVAALRALARTHSTDPGAIPLADEHAWIKGYLATMAVTGEPGVETHAESKGRLKLLVGDAVDGRQALLGALTALGDAEPTPSATGALAVLVRSAAGPLTPDVVEAAARASIAVGGDALLDWLLARLGQRAGRAAVRSALVAIGSPALARLGAALGDDATDRSTRIQIPRTLQMFQSQAAADALVACLHSGAEGLLRYKALRALGRLVADFEARVDTVRVRLLARGELVEHARLIGLREAVADLDVPDESLRDVHALTVRLLEDKAKHGLERAFRAIKLCFPTEDIHRVHEVAMHGDAVARANAAEFLDALLAPQGGPKRQREDGLRQLLRVVTDQLAPGDRISRISVVTGNPVPQGARAALDVLAADPDPALSAFASALRGARRSSPVVAAAGAAVAEDDTSPFDPIAVGDLAGSHG